MALPLGEPWNQAQTKWKSQLDPLLANPSANPTVLKAVVLAIGANVINHKLQRIQQGWRITDINAASTIYRSQPFNSTTLTLTSSAVCTIDLEVF